MENIEFYERRKIELFYSLYSETVRLFLQTLELKGMLVPDHIGCFMHNPEEFNNVSLKLEKFSRRIKDISLQQRRVRVFKLDAPLIGTYLMPKIEIFEPKIDDLKSKNNRYGIEHISFFVSDWDEFVLNNRGKLPIAKEGSVGESKFIKTEIINTVEIEFRNDKLGEEE